MGLRIHRTKHTERYVILPHYITRDQGLSFCARGLLAYLLSLPDGWNVSTDQLGTASHESRTAVRRAMQELRDAGFVQVRTERDAGGHLRSHLDVADTARGQGASGTTSQNSASPQVGTGRGTSGVWSDQDKHEFPQVAPDAGRARPIEVREVSTERSNGLDETPAFSPLTAQVPNGVGDVPQAVTRASRWTDPRDIAAQQAAESRAQRQRQESK